MDSYFERIVLSSVERQNVSKTGRKVQVHGQWSEYTFLNSEKLSGLPSFSDKLPAARRFSFRCTLFLHLVEMVYCLQSTWHDLQWKQDKLLEIIAGAKRTDVAERRGRGHQNKRPAKDLFDER